MAVSTDAYRDAARLYASGVTLVGVSRDGKPHGMTATAFAAVSLEPPLVLVCLELNSRTRAAALASGHFSVNILSAAQKDIAETFSRAGDKDFDAIPHSLDPGGAPLLAEALAAMSCRVVSTARGGDHDVVVGEVLSASTRPGEPLLYYDRTYRTLRG
jgi:flavin reductase